MMLSFMGYCNIDFGDCFAIFFVYHHVITRNLHSLSFQTRHRKST